MVFCEHCSEREGRRLAFIFLGTPEKEAFVEWVLRKSAELMDEGRLQRREDAADLSQEFGESLTGEEGRVWEVERIMKHVIASAQAGELAKEGNTWHWMSGLKGKKTHKLCDLMKENVERYPGREDIQKIFQPESAEEESS